MAELEHRPRLAGMRMAVLDTAALSHERALGPDRPRQAGLTSAEEAELLAAWQADG